MRETGKMTDLETMIRSVPFYGMLSDDEKKLLERNIFAAHYSRGDVIHGRVSDCTGMIFVYSGSACASMTSDDGREIILYRLEAGDVCSLSASCVIRAITFDVTVEAETETEALILKSSVFKELYDRNIRVQNFALNTAVERFSDVMWSFQQIVFTKLDRRLAAFLYDETVKRKSDVVPLTHDEIARYIGSVRETVSRMLKYFERENIVSLSRHGVTVTDREALKRLAM